MTMKSYIENDDLLGAYNRYQSTNNTWKNRWWETVESIYYSSIEWASKFIIDPVKRILTQIKQVLTPKKKKGRPSIIDKVMTFNVPAEGCGAYVVQHFNSKGESMWIKPGKADDARKRMAEHFRKDYKDTDIATGVCLAWFPCKNKNHALSVENILRDHFESKGFQLLGQDRFPDLQKITEEDWNEINRRINFINLAW